MARYFDESDVHAIVTELGRRGINTINQVILILIFTKHALSSSWIQTDGLFASMFLQH